jgi:hypothetical protein
VGGWIDIFLNTLQCFPLFIDSSDEFGFFVERIFRSMGKSVGQVVLLIAQFNWSRYKAGVVFPHQFSAKCISVTAVRIIGHIDRVCKKHTSSARNDRKTQHYNAI